MINQYTQHEVDSIIEEQQCNRYKRLCNAALNNIQLIRAELEKLGAFPNQALVPNWMCVDDIMVEITHVENQAVVHLFDATERVVKTIPTSLLFSETGCQTIVKDEFEHIRLSSLDQSRQQIQNLITARNQIQARIDELQASIDQIENKNG